MIHKTIQRLFFVILSVLIATSVSFAFAANIVVPITRLTDQSSAVTADTLKPAACTSITLTTILYCPAAGGACMGTDASELIIGSAAADDIQSGKGNDCILGAGSDDSIRGEQGTDVCIGGPGTNTFHQSCEMQTP